MNVLILFILVVWFIMAAALIMVGEEEEFRADTRKIWAWPIVAIFWPISLLYSLMSKRGEDD